ncbi:MAG: sulfatase [Acidobacteriota bacterium]|nr:sulfatase [Acidobacteriota bacterium]
MIKNKLSRACSIRIAAFTVAVLSFVSVPPLCAAARPGSQLNFIFVLVDDLGWTDLGCYGSRFYETPNIDRLASRGMKFTQAYSACTVCSPSRASILTGQYPARLHLTDFIAGHQYPWAKLRVPDWTKYLPLEHRTIAEALKTRGYATASIGKWHLGSEGYDPLKQGFDLNLAGTNRGQPPSYFAPYRIPTLEDGPAGEYLTDREAGEALKFIEANRNKPFLLYLPHHAVHTPIQAKKEVTERYRRKIKADVAQQNPAYAALIESVDESIGRVMQKLAELKIDERTVIIFTSDNGGLLPVTSNVPLRAGKGSAYEGGVRVPAIVLWPGVIRPGSTSDVPIIGADFYPTILEMAKVKLYRNQVVDGTSIVGVLKGARSSKRDALYWHYPHYHHGSAKPYSAIRQGDLKLIEFYEDNHVELYNIRNDIGEKEDLAQKMPQKRDELKLKLHAWRQAVKAQMPTPNPDHDPAKADVSGSRALELQRKK